LNPGRRGGKPATNRLSYGASPVDISLLRGFPPPSSEMLASHAGIDLKASELSL
jgi:hypothetical protein